MWQIAKEVVSIQCSKQNPGSTDGHCVQPRGSGRRSGKESQLSWALRADQWELRGRSFRQRAGPMDYKPSEISSMYEINKEDTSISEARESSTHQSSCKVSSWESREEEKGLYDAWGQRRRDDSKHTPCTMNCGRCYYCVHHHRVERKCPRGLRGKYLDLLFRPATISPPQNNGSSTEDSSSIQMCLWAKPQNP